MHPVSFDAQYQVERNRLTAFFRLLLAIPWILWAYLYGIATVVVVLIAWFALMFTGRYPEGLYNFVAGFIRFASRLAAWVTLATDEVPPFGGGPKPEYPVQVEVAPRQESYSRAKTFFKLVLYFPQMLITQATQSLVGAGMFVTWWRILFTGKQSATMHDALLAGLAYTIRANSFLMLVTEAHPRLLELPPSSYPADAPALPQAVTAAPSPHPAEAS